MGVPAGSIDWKRLLREFDAFEPDEEIRRIDPSVFLQSLIEPCPPFARALVERKRRKHLDRAESARALYAFLLEKRYQERLNLLHFAFSIFDDDTRLPQTVIDRTPFPHEEGQPPFTHINDPDFKIVLE